MNHSCQADELRVAAGLFLLVLGRLGESKLPTCADQTGSSVQAKLCHFLLGSRCWALEALQRKVFVRKKHSRAPAPKDWLQGQPQEIGCKGEPGLRASLPWRIWGVQSPDASRDAGILDLHMEPRVLDGIHSRASEAGRGGGDYSSVTLDS